MGEPTEEPRKALAVLSSEDSDAPGGPRMTEEPGTREAQALFSGQALRRRGKGKHATVTVVISHVQCTEQPMASRLMDIARQADFNFAALEKGARMRGLVRF